MLLYHVSTGLCPYGFTRFVPDIPRSAVEPEDLTIPRICFADSAAHALQATGYSLSEGDCLTVYILNTNDIDPDAIVFPGQLNYMGLVPDAVENQEYWVLVPVELEGKAAIISEIKYQKEKHRSFGNFTYVTHLKLSFIDKEEPIWDAGMKHAC